MTELTDQERRAINAYLGENWGDFVQTAELYLDADEVEELAKKLEG
jgi:hypothetical protein